MFYSIQEEFRGIPGKNWKIINKPQKCSERLLELNEIKYRHIIQGQWERIRKNSRDERGILKQ